MSIGFFFRDFIDPMCLEVQLNPFECILVFACDDLFKFFYLKPEIALLFNPIFQIV